MSGMYALSQQSPMSADPWGVLLGEPIVTKNQVALLIFQGVTTKTAEVGLGPKGSKGVTP
jgi:hypothetical protein